MIGTCECCYRTVVDRQNISRCEVCEYYCVNEEEHIVEEYPRILNGYNEEGIHMVAKIYLKEFGDRYFVNDSQVDLSFIGCTGCYNFGYPCYEHLRKNMELGFKIDDIEMVEMSYEEFKENDIRWKQRLPESYSEFYDTFIYYERSNDRC